MREAFKTSWLIFALGLATWPGPAFSSSNRLQNPEFDSDTSSWSFYSLGETLIDDSNGCAASHAVSSLSAGDPEIEQQVVWISQCVPLGSPVPAELFARVSVHGPAARL